MHIVLLMLVDLVCTSCEMVLALLASQDLSQILQIKIDPVDWFEQLVQDLDKFILQMVFLVYLVVLIPELNKVILYAEQILVEVMKLLIFMVAALLVHLTKFPMLQDKIVFQLKQFVQAQERSIRLIELAALHVNHTPELRITTSIVHQITAVLINRLILMDGALSVLHTQLYHLMEEDVLNQFASVEMWLMLQVHVELVHLTLDLIYQIEKAVGKTIVERTLS